jgi:DNA-binding response OmpR family regulator
LVAEGYSVDSALGRAEAIEHCRTAQADMLVLGHSVPRDQKRDFVDLFRRSNNAPVLSVLRTDQEKLPDVDFGVEFLNPDSFVRTVRSILEASGTPG